jgi:hypothetical protein
MQTWHLRFWQFTAIVLLIAFGWACRQRDRAEHLAKERQAYIRNLRQLFEDHGCLDWEENR